MDRNQNSFASLADRVEAGDAGAPAQLRRELEPEMVRIVRRALRDGRGRTPLDRRILAEARHVGWHADLAAGAERERLIEELARCVCTSVLGGLRPRNDHPAEETVCGNDAF
jgi:hypothetical protein